MTYIMKIIQRRLSGNKETKKLEKYLIKKKITHISAYVNKLLEVMDYNIPMSANEIMDKLGLKSKDSFRDNYLNPALENGLIKMTLPDKPTSKNQCIIKIKLKKLMIYFISDIHFNVYFVLYFIFHYIFVHFVRKYDKKYVFFVRKVLKCI